MKKIIITVLITILAVSLCACGSQTKTEEPAVSPEVATVQTTEAPAAYDASNYLGDWYVDAVKSGYDKVYTRFGSSFRDYGSRLTIGNDKISFYIGAAGGEGTYTFSDGVFAAQLVEYNEKNNVSYNFKVFNENSSVYLTQEFTDGDGILTVYWTKTPPTQTDPNATPTPQVVIVGETPQETAAPTPTPQIVYVVEEPKTQTAEATTNVNLKTLSTFESQYTSTVNTYSTAISNNWSVDDCYTNNINYLVGLMNSAGNGKLIGYCYGDVDGNGIDELIIGEGNQIYAMYTLVNNQPKMVVDAGERSAYYLEPDGCIVNVGSSSAFLSAYTFYLLKGDKIVVNNALVSDYSVNEKEPWFYAEDDDWDVSNDSHISTDKAEKWIKAYQDNYITFPYMPLAY